jgi:hypothetical protein
MLVSCIGSGRNGRGPKEVDWVDRHPQALFGASEAAMVSTSEVEEAEEESKATEKSNDAEADSASDDDEEEEAEEAEEVSETSQAGRLCFGMPPAAARQLHSLVSDSRARGLTVDGAQERPSKKSKKQAAPAPKKAAKVSYGSSARATKLKKTLAACTIKCVALPPLASSHRRIGPITAPHTAGGVPAAGWPPICTEIWIRRRTLWGDWRRCWPKRGWAATRRVRRSRR